MIRLNRLAVILTVIVLCSASAIAAFAYLNGGALGGSTSSCTVGNCTATTGPVTVTLTKTVTATITETITSYITSPVTTTVTTTSLVTTTMTTTFTQTCCIMPPQRLGFWVDERDMWSGAGLNWTPQEFVSNYFEEPPYPSALLFATSMAPSGTNSPGAIGEAQWLSQVATTAQDSGLNAKILLLFFVNLSGNTINGVPDQTTLLTQYLNALGHHSNIYGAEYEREYYGDNATEEQTFHNIVTAAGYVDILNPNEPQSAAGDRSLDYSTFPYYNGTIPSSLPSGNVSIGVGYGETGAPVGSAISPVWTNATIRAIVDTSPANPFVLIYAGSGGTGQPPYQLWNWSTLRGWIWSDPRYLSTYITA